jgi:pilus assembly protein Flp/PilA
MTEDIQHQPQLYSCFRRKDMRKLFQKLRREQKGAAFVEYALLIAGVALIGSAAVAIFGHKTNDMIAMTAAVLPGAHVDDNAPIISGKIIETNPGAVGAGGATGIALDIDAITAGTGTSRLGANVGSFGAPLASLVLEAK